MAAGAKLLMIFPRPQNEAAFEQEYKDVHAPMLESHLKGLSRFVATKVVSSPGGEAKTYRLAEMHFANMQTLTDCLETQGAKTVLEHANFISTGGAPIVLICDEETFLYW